MSLLIELRQGAKLVMSRTPRLTPEFVTTAFDLTEVERALITNWSTLHVHLIARDTQVQVSWVELEIPGTGGGEPQVVSAVGKAVSWS